VNLSVFTTSTLKPSEASGMAKPTLNPTRLSETISVGPGHRHRSQSWPWGQWLLCYSGHRASWYDCSYEGGYKTSAEAYDKS